MKKMFVFLFFFFSFLAFNVQTVSADIGPKATAEVTIIGIEGEYSFELLVPYRGDVTENPLEDWENYVEYDYYKETYPERLVYFQDEDGFAACSFYYGPPCNYRQTGEHRYRMTYFSAPRVFKVAIVTEDDVLIVSERIERQMFQASFTFDLTGVDTTQDQFGVGVINEELPIREAISSFFLRVILTIGIELGILALFMYRKAGSFKLVGIVNLISQTLLTLGILIAYYYASIFGAIAIFIIGEIFVFTFEIVVYAIKLKEKSIKRAVIYGFVANATTFMATIFIVFIEALLYG